MAKGGQPRSSRKLSLVLASEGAECGLACVVMVSRYYGVDIDLNGARQRFPISLSGASLRNIMSLADQLGFGTRALRAEVGDLSNIRLPAVLHWDLDHFVVLAAFKPRHIVVFDPARGRRVLSHEEFSLHYTGVALELAPTWALAPIHASAPIKLTSLWSRIEGIWGNLAQLLALSAILQLLALAAPFQLQLVIDGALAGGDADLLTIIAIGFGSLALLQTLLEAARNWTLQTTGYLMSLQVMGNLVHHLMRLSAVYFERRHVGDILSRMTSSAAIQDFFTRGVVAVLIDGFMALATFVILFVYSPMLASIILLGLFFLIAIAFAFYPAMRTRLDERLVASAKEQTFLMESVRAATTIKLMGREAEREGLWRNLYGDVINASLASGRLGILSSLLQSALSGFLLVLVIYLGSRLILAGQGLSVGMLIAFLSYHQTLSARVSSLIGQFVQFRLLGLHLERLADIITAEPDPPADSVSGGAAGQIRFENVSFRYGSSDPLVLDDISFEIPAGDFIAITGPSGSGKTTLLKLLLGLQQPTFGAIYLDGHPAAGERWREWRTAVGVVAQDDRLLSGSIADNICFFDPDMNMDRVQRAARTARIHDDIMRKPMRYRTLIGDMGSSLSSGQRQRILLARALYRQPSILILDEGTANLDEQTEDALAQVIAQLPITRIAVAHRPALLRRARRVCILEDAKLTFRVGAALEVEGVV